jgi:hypothetical protein
LRRIDLRITARGLTSWRAAFAGLIVTASACGSITVQPPDSGGVDGPGGHDAGPDATAGDAPTSDAVVTADGGSDRGGCVAEAAADPPDDNFVDSNCDGIDGDVARAIFVAPSGSDTNEGTMAAPVATIGAAIAKAQANGKSDVYISAGTYTGRVTLARGISLYGGYAQASGWSRSAAHMATISATTEIGGRMIAVVGAEITAPTTVDRLTIQTSDAVSAGASSYGLHCVRCTALTLKNCIVAAGRGAAGSRGPDGPPGGNGVNGNGGGMGLCDASPPGAGGPGGALSCSGVDVSGGRGGAGAPAGANNGMTGEAGKNGGGGPGAGGPGGDPGGSGARGINGGTVSAGMPGGGGMLGMLTGGFWFGMPGADGTPGPAGRGGGGGGGGGGQGCLLCVGGAGNGGGGGGSGGCGGGPGRGGGAGGGSFGLFLVDSTGILVAGCTVSSAKGGDGGPGGAGGPGGMPGLGQPGGRACLAEIGPGGDGGNGSRGGDGGGGGGGAGGPSYAIYRMNTTVALAGNPMTNQAGGVGGLGGTPGGGMGAPGAASPAF